MTARTAGQARSGRPWPGRWALLAGALALAAAPPAALAQNGPANGPPGFYATPSLTLSGVFDDNVFATGKPREADFITRFTPGISAGYHSAPLTITGAFDFDAEIYAVNPDLDNVGDRQRGVLAVRYLPDRRLTLALGAAYAKTNRPVELSVQQGLQPIARLERGFDESTGFTISPSVAYRLTPLWTASAAYSFSLVDADGGTTTTTQGATLGLTRLFTPRDTGTVRYTAQLFDSSDEGSETSHTLTLGWERRFSPFTLARLVAGPRVTDGKLGAEVAAGLQHRLKWVELSLTYAHTQAVVVGQGGTVITDTLGGQVSFTPLQRLQVSVGPGFQRSSGESGASRSEEPTNYYSLYASVTYQINRWLFVRASYSFSLQDGRSQPQILHNILSISLAAAYPMRID